MKLFTKLNFELCSKIVGTSRASREYIKARTRYMARNFTRHFSKKRVKIDSSLFSICQEDLVPSLPFHDASIFKRPFAIGIASLIIAVISSANGATIIGFDPNGNAGNEATINSTTTSSGLNSSILSRGSGLSASSLANAFGSQNFTASGNFADAVANNKYLQITISAQVGKKVSLNTLTANFRRSSTGPNAFQWRYSLDGFATIGTDVGSAISYTGTDANGLAQGAITLSGISALQNVPSGTTITLRLYGWGATGTSGTFAIGRLTGDDLAVDGTVADNVLSAPVSIAATSVTSTSFNANWNSVSGATSYRLDVSTASNFSPLVSGYNDLNVGNVTTYPVTGLNASTTYYYRLRAYNGTATSGNSSTTSVTTLAAAVPKITVTLPGQSSANTGTPSEQTAGTPFSVTITATTDGTTTDTSYTGSHNITFTVASGSAVSPASANVTFTSGVGTLNVTLTNTTATTITATDGTIAGTASSSLTINPGAIDSYSVSASSPQNAGTGFGVSVTAKDPYGNTVTTDSSTSVTMSSGSGHMTFDANPKTLANGSITVNATDNTVETTTIIATDGNGKTGASANVSITALPKYRSKQSGNWNVSGSWEVSNDNGVIWVAASGSPASSDGTITIRNGHTITNTTSTTVDEVTVGTGGTLVLNTAFTVNNGTGDDIDVQSGGVFLLPSSGVSPSWNTGATAKIETGGVLKVTAGSLTGSGSGVNADNFVYQDGSILECATGPSTSGVTFFPNVDSSTIPVFRLNANPNPGGSSPTVINGVFEAASGTSSTWQGPATVTFRNGLRGSGDVTQSTLSGLFVINGATAELGGAGKINLGDFTGNGLGLFITNGSVVSLTSSKSITIGTITNRGTFNLNNYSLTGDAVVRIASRGILKGPGAINGVLTCDSGGTIIAGGTSAIGTLTLATAPTFSGTNFMKIDRNNSSPLADKVVLSSGTLAFGGTLTVSNAGAALVGGEVFDLFDASAYSGSFAATNLPLLGTGLNWYLGNLTTDGTIRVNQKPVPSASKWFTNVATLTLKIPLASLVAGASDSDGDTVTLSGINLTTANGSTLVTNATYIFYTNAATMPDSFTYTISDGRAGTATGTVNIAMLTSVTGQMSTPTVNGRSVSLHFAGHPTWAYSVERSINDLASWETIWTTNAPSGGTFDFDDDVGEPPPGSVYYRLRWTP